MGDGVGWLVVLVLAMSLVKPSLWQSHFAGRNSSEKLSVSWGEQGGHRGRGGGVQFESVMVLMFAVAPARPLTCIALLAE